MKNEDRIRSNDGCKTGWDKKNNNKTEGNNKTERQKNKYQKRANEHALYLQFRNQKTRPFHSPASLFVVCSAVQEAEIADVERRTRHNLGYAQLPTLILCDNEFAVGLANHTIVPKPKLSLKKHS
jgi:hypothetical protein